MKKLLLLTALLVFGTQLFAQNPSLYRTWYLYSVMDTDLGDNYIVSEINPPINPFITISETSNPESAEINGEGACNSFSGLYAIDEINYEPMEFTKTDEDCGYQIHNFFENGFFNFMQGPGSYQINSDNQGMTLVMINPLMGNALFKDYPLSVPNNKIAQIKIYPNPVSNQLFVVSEKKGPLVLNVFSITGKKVLGIKNIEDGIDVSKLSNGIYLLEIISAEGKTVQKFIKN